MSAVVETSFFHPKNVGFSNSKLGWAADHIYSEGIT